MFSVYDPSQYPTGVLNPLGPREHAWNTQASNQGTRFHGPIFDRPMASYPWGERPLWGVGNIDETAACGIGEWERVEAYKDGVFMDKDGNLIGELQAYHDGSLGALGQARKIDCVNCSCDDPDCLVACPGCASGISQVDCAICSCQKPDCAVSCSSKCSPINCATCDCGNPTCQTWCPKCKWKYPWLIYSKDTVALQKEIDACLAAKGMCRLGTPDGKLGPKTCGAAVFCGISEDLLITCKDFVEPSICQPVRPSVPGPVACGPGEQLIDGDCVAIGPAAKPKKAGISTAWIVGGLIGAAAIAGVYAATRKKA